MSKQEKINEQIEMALKADCPDGWTPVVIETKMTPRARKAWIGFRFELKENATVGSVIKNDDRSISKILAVA